MIEDPGERDNKVEAGSTKELEDDEEEAAIFFVFLRGRHQSNHSITINLLF